MKAGQPVKWQSKGHALASTSHPRTIFATAQCASPLGSFLLRRVLGNVDSHETCPGCGRDYIGQHVDVWEPPE
jgi:hypothetical protein